MGDICSIFGESGPESRCLDGIRCMDGLSREAAKPSYSLNLCKLFRSRASLKHPLSLHRQGRWEAETPVGNSMETAVPLSSQSGRSSVRIMELWVFRRWRGSWKYNLHISTFACFSGYNSTARLAGISCLPTLWALNEAMASSNG
ncbi:hypothetical protein H112_05803 [Trichophyton rubrum D6]|nr:hypothetical protein H112_05803 [Trichophyton rubrum D6]